MPDDMGQAASAVLSRLRSRRYPLPFEDVMNSNTRWVFWCALGFLNGYAVSHVVLMCMAGITRLLVD